MNVAHFTSETFGGAGIAAQRLHDALRRQNVESRFYYGTGAPFVENCEPVFQINSFFWRNAAALARSWRNRRSAPEAFFTSPKWIGKRHLPRVGQCLTWLTFN